LAIPQNPYDTILPLSPIDPNVKKVLAIAQRNCDRLVRLVDDTLDLHKILAGKMSFSMDVINLKKLVESTLAANQPFAERLGIVLNSEGVADDVFVVGDWVRLEQVMTNILSNAAKFSPKGSEVKIKIEMGQGRARILVIDTGIGLSENEKAAVFDRYSKVNTVGTKLVGGTGIGMNISEKIMQAHDGQIDYYKNQDVGTTFFVELPMCVPQACTAEEMAGAEKEEASAAA
jgi:signal transduction histidine kinase